jgi:stage II sporulation protein GA (sporulation sigma-E factor processing peptidase)
VKCQGEGFLDTGNGLRDPLSQRPVVVAEYELLKECFPDDCKLAMKNFRDDNDILQALSKSSWANRIRVIPFSSIGKKNGLMVGLRCDEIIVDPGKTNILYKNLVVGIYMDKLSAKDNYQLLIPSEILEKI